MDSYEFSCEQYSPSIVKKCSYSNSVCSESNKSCKELENQDGFTEDICNLATISGCIPFWHFQFGSTSFKNM